MKKIVALFFLLVCVLGHLAILFAECVFETEPSEEMRLLCQYRETCILNPEIPDKVLPGLIQDTAGVGLRAGCSTIIGWSRDSKLAYIRATVPAEPVGELYDVIVMDLITDKVLEQVDLGTHSKQDPMKIILQVRKALKAHRIIYHPTPTTPLSLRFNGETVSGKPIQLGDTTIVPRLTNDSLIFRKPDSKREKVITTLDPNQFSIQGVVKSPFENRLAVEYQKTETCSDLYCDTSRFFLGSHLSVGYK